MNSMELDADNRSRIGPVRHVGLIPDGARRWARRERVSLSRAYLLTLQYVAVLIELFLSRNARSVSVYLCSKQNLSRPPEEMTALYEAIESSLGTGIQRVAVQGQRRVIAVGHTGLLPEPLRASIADLETQTCVFTAGSIYLCLAYDPIDEIMDALAAAPSPEMFQTFMKVREPVDIVFRTSGVSLLSNFLPLQCAYARLAVLSGLFNDTVPGDYIVHLDQIESDVRRFGE